MLKIRGRCFEGILTVLWTIKMLKRRGRCLEIAKKKLQCDRIVYIARTINYRTWANPLLTIGKCGWLGLPSKLQLAARVVSSFGLTIVTVQSSKVRLITDLRIYTRINRSPLCLVTHAYPITYLVTI
jgi:hypothetical protein